MALAARALAPQRQPGPARPGRRARRLRVRVAGKGVTIGAIVAIPLALVLAYVWLTAQLTAQTYRLHDAQARQSTLLQQDAELRQRVARLSSLPRLEAAAAKLHMTVPSGVALIAPKLQSPPGSRITAIAASIADVRRWFTVR
jgi:hypothetical protein